MAKGNGVTRQELYCELKELRRESNLQYTAIAEFMGKSDACIQANASDIEELKVDVKYLERRDWKAGIIASIVGAAAGFFGSQR